MMQALDGVTVIDLSRAVAGPYCGMLLGDIGARVIKVETPGDGDDSRHYEPTYAGESCYFLVTNRNKRSITLDLKSAEGQAVLDRLLQAADVLIENFRPAAAKRLDLAPDRVAERYPRLVHCSITGFGASGPRAELPAMDAMIQAFAGTMSFNGESDGPPARMGIAVADLGAALFATYGIQAALAARARTGCGQLVQTSLMESLVALQCYQNAITWGTGHPPERMGSGHPAFAPLQVYAVADGFLQVMAGTQKHWLALCDAIEAPELKHDPRFRTNPDRVHNKPALNEILERILRKRTRAEWILRFSGTEVMTAPVNRIDEALQEEQVQLRDMVVTRAHSGRGPMNFTGFPVKLSSTPAAFTYDPPGVGEHTDEVLAEFGFGPADIAALRGAGAI